jgi:hypothetical protein
LTVKRAGVAMGAALVIQPDGGIADVNFKPGGNQLALILEHPGCPAIDGVRTDRR